MKDLRLEEYEIHEVAGTHFLINVKQPGLEFIKPVEVNEFGAMIIKYLKEGKSAEEAGALISKEYEADIDVVLKDIAEFTDSLYEKIC